MHDGDYGACRWLVSVRRMVLSVGGLLTALYLFPTAATE